MAIGFSTRNEGVADAKNDWKDGWIDQDTIAKFDYDGQKLSEYLTSTIGSTPEYNAAYVETVLELTREVKQSD